MNYIIGLLAVKLLAIVIVWHLKNCRKFDNQFTIKINETWHRSSSS